MYVFLLLDNWLVTWSYGCNTFMCMADTVTESLSDRREIIAIRLGPMLIVWTYC